MCACGTLGFGGNALFSLLSGAGPASTMLSYHVADAASSSSLANSLNVAGSGVGAGALAGLAPTVVETAGPVAGEATVAGSAAGWAAAAAPVAGAVAAAGGIIGGAWAIDHAREVGELPDPDIISPPGGTPLSPDTVDPTAPTMPAPGPTWPAPPGNPPRISSRGSPRRFPVTLRTRPFQGHLNCQPLMATKIPIPAIHRCRRQSLTHRTGNTALQRSRRLTIRM
jgi:hypothetical protein